MKKTLFAMMAATAAILVGCDWGGAGDGTWNDAYSWANFSGTYKLTKAITTTTTSEDGTTTTTAAEPNYVTRTENFKAGAGYNQSGAVRGDSVTLGPLKAGSVTITVTGGNNTKISFSDNGSGSLVSSQAGCSGTINYSTGKWTLKTNVQLSSSYTISCTYTYIGSIPGGGTTGGGTTGETATITWLNVTQQGNVFTFTDSKGVVYSGKITGASMPGSGYTVSGNIRLSFEVSAANGAKMVGSFNGDWSGASDASSGVLSNRSLDATYRRGKTSEQVFAVSGSVNITPSSIVGQEAAY